MKKFSFILLSLLFTGITYGQDAKTLLKEVSAKAKGYENITIDFKYNLHNSTENLNQETRGDVTLEGNKYVLNMLGTSRIFDGKNIYTIVPEDEEVTVSAFDPKNDKEIT